MTLAASPTEAISDYEELDILPARNIEGRLEAVYAALADGFETGSVDQLDLTYEGIPSDRHAGITRPSGAREPWYKRGTEMRNERQLTLVAGDELDRIAAGMGIEQVNPRWIGANMVISGVERLSMLPPGTLMFFEGGVTLKIDGQNAPCRLAGGAVAKRYPDRDGLGLLFPKVAKRLRGLLAWVEKPGTVKPGEAIKIRLPEQWLYR
ncbi:MOSC domain-containing protein [Tepidamorphus sp. 3E244]|uniref:MOSC domain-containing protein n=1 Tax=Tepidamorphus sp. 3E244 TaxID=3385498 RepID=UPI0038FD23E2